MLCALLVGFSTFFDPFGRPRFLGSSEALCTMLGGAAATGGATTGALCTAGSISDSSIGEGASGCATSTFFLLLFLGAGIGAILSADVTSFNSSFGTIGSIITEAI